MNVNNWEQILSKAGCNIKECKDWAPFFSKYAKEFTINTPKRVAAFVANVVVESQYLRIMRENLRYSAKGLAKTWPKRYSDSGKPNAKALAIAGNQVAIANHCYANRMGNGPEESGDGWRYAGKGPIQLTGKSNVQAFFTACKLPKDTDPEELVRPDLGAKAAMWFWKSNNINNFADVGDFDGCCDKVNIGSKTRQLGDAHGYNHRRKVYDTLMAMFNANPKLMEDSKQVVVDAKTMEKTIAPEITWIEQDPDGEYVFDLVENYTAL